MSLATIAPHLSDEGKAFEFIESLIWPNGPVCPHCEATDRIYKMTANPAKRIRHGLHKCGHCRKQFTVRVGTIFEDSNLPMRTWLMIISMMCSSKKGVSACQIQRTCGISYKAAWFACHRIREAMKKEPLVGLLGSGEDGIVEADETFVGGKAKNNRHKGRKRNPKVAVMTLIDRDGDVRSFKVPNTKKSTLQTVLRPNVDRSAVIMTDENPSYRGANKYFRAHHAVNHSDQFVRAVIIHTNFAESYHALLKRSIIGTHHHLSAKHLPRYLREREFHWNARKDTDAERMTAAVKGAKGKRLLYSSPTT